ncbi:MAG: PQQ-binding-like beta-propeller repeat protein, partial [Verrucomicrobiota bacterium]|nr:PQQ-binding-like beta-propeller repeat protein [Verrucomicrobiota bacterium]
EEKNITWKSAVPGQGYSSPVIAGNQIWMTSAEEKGKSLHAVCLNKTTGKLLHDVEVLRTEDAGPKHRLNGYASPTPVLDGEHVFVHFGPRGTACLDTAGKVIWKNSQFKFNVIQGAASSPILYGNLLILTCDGIDNQFIVALDKKTGKTIWKQPRAHLEAAAKKRPIAKMAYSTPLIQSINGAAQLVCSGADHVAAYDLTTGREIWWMPYDGFSIVGRPSYGNDLFYVVGSIRQDHFCIFALKPGKGRLRDDQVLWQFSTGIGHVPSPILVGGEIYAVHDGGVAGCIDALTGKELWRERLGGNHDASPIEIRGRIYFCNREGKTTVLAADRKFKVLSINQLKSTFKASPAVADSALFLRSDTHLYRIEKPVD